MSLPQLFDLFTFDQEASLLITRKDGKYQFTVGETLSTMFTSESLEKGLQCAIELTTPTKTMDDRMEKGAALLKEMIGREGGKLDCQITKTVFAGELKNRLICTVVVEIVRRRGEEYEKPIVQVFDPVCGWTEEDVKTKALAMMLAQIAMNSE